MSDQRLLDIAQRTADHLFRHGGSSLKSTFLAHEDASHVRLNTSWGEGPVRDVILQALEEAVGLDAAQMRERLGLEPSGCVHEWRFLRALPFLSQREGRRDVFYCTRCLDKRGVPQ